MVRRTAIAVAWDVKLHNKLKRITKCSNMVANNLPADPPTPMSREGRGIGQNFFSEHVHVVYQIKGNQECRDMVANILLAERPHPLTLGLGSKGVISTFSELVMLHIKFNGITKCSNMVANILPADLPPRR